MFLKRIEIYGFKSFAQRSVLDFEYGKSGNITAVVGPNGSGKSNVADAIRWVTGEQSSKNLRSKKGEDVIFCGSSAKPRGSYAEVSITLADDKPFKFELNNKEHSMTEIEVSRKLYRSGESEYLINHKKVRLTDIQQLLASLGFGQSSYTVIGQGMVDRLLFFTASERKVLFDEAAGVKQYEIKREQAIRKLESTDSNLIRLRDILTELTPRVVNLRRLVKRAEGRKELEGELSTTQERYFGSLHSEYTHSQKYFDARKSELNKKVIQFEEQITALEKKSQETRENPFVAERREAENDISSLSQKRDSLLQEVSYLKGQIASVGHEQMTSVSRESDLKAEKKALDEKIAFLGGKVADEKTGLTGQEALLEKLKGEVDVLTGKITNVSVSLEKPLADDGGKLDGLKLTIEDLRTRKAQAGDVSNRLSEQQSLLDGANSTLATLEKNISSLEHAITVEEDEIKNVKKEENKLATELGKLESELSDLSSKLSEEGLAELDRALAIVEKERETLGKMDDKGLKTAFKDFANRLNKLFVQIRHISKAVKATEREKVESRVKAIRAELTTINDELTVRQVALAGNQARLVSTKSNIDEQQGRIATLETAIKELQERRIEVNDDEITKLEAEIKKYEGTASERQNVLLREKDSLTQTLNGLRGKYHSAELEYSRNKSVLDNQEAEISSSEKRLTEIEDSLAELTQVPKNADLSAVEAELKSKDRELNKLEEDLAKHRGGLTQIITSEREFEQGGIALERERRDLSEQRGQIQNQLSNLEVELAKTSVRLEDLTSEMKALNIQINEAKHSYLDQMEKDVLKLKMENLRRKLDTTAGVDPETEAEYTELEQREAEMSTQVEDLTKAKADLEKVVAELDARIKHQFADVFQHISTEFSRYFSMLFNGGNASLKLGEDEEGSFGIEISANPPGKRVQSLAALSGGERTLTSLALLFAILSVNPSPFCVLDEVDAALDESNTQRFIKILGDLAKKTQFIIISHNRDTMKVASSLYGVTMNDEHISKLLSVKLTEALVSAKQ